MEQDVEQVEPVLVALVVVLVELGAEQDQLDVLDDGYDDVGEGLQD